MRYNMYSTLFKTRKKLFTLLKKTSRQVKYECITSAILSYGRLVTEDSILYLSTGSFKKLKLNVSKLKGHKSAVHISSSVGHTETLPCPYWKLWDTTFHQKTHFVLRISVGHIRHKDTVGHISSSGNLQDTEKQWKVCRTVGNSLP